MAARTTRGNDPRSCQACDYGECFNCHGFAQGPQYAQADRSVPCACAEAGHPAHDECRDNRYGEWSMRICVRPAKREVEGYSWVYGAPEDGHLKRLCGIHANGVEKSAANMARWRAEWDERDAQRKRDREANRAAHEHLEKVRALLSTLDIHPDQATVEHAKIALPPETMETVLRDLVEAIGLHA